MLNIGIRSDGTQFRLVTDVATETNSVLGQRGSGKTYAAQVIAEEMVKAGVQICVIDPLDCWNGIRSSADGKSAGLSIIVIGGFKGDLPLEAGTGVILADFVVDNPTTNVILSLRHLSNTKQQQFVADFCKHIYHRKGAPDKQNPLHVFIDEADAFAPQHLYPETRKCFGAVDDLVRRGRSSGIGVTLITQRAAVINKDVLSQTATLVCLKTTGPHDRKALESWIDAHDTGDRQAVFMASLASLQTGETWFWSPGRDIFERVKIRKKHTFDSSATPKAGERRIDPKVVAPVDLNKLKLALNAVIETAKSNDPGMLKSKIRELEQKIKQLEARKPEAPQRPPIDFFPFKKISTELNVQLEPIQEMLDRLVSAIKDAEATQSIKIPGVTLAPGFATKFESAFTKSAPACLPGPAMTVGDTPEVGFAKLREKQRIREASEQSKGDSNLGKCERTVIGTLISLKSACKETLAVKSVYSVNSGGFKNSLSTLRTSGLIYNKGDILHPTNIAVETLHSLPIYTTEALVEIWSAKLDKCERTLLDALLKFGASSKPTLASNTNYQYTSGGFKNALSTLRTLGLIGKRLDMIELSEHIQ